VLLADGAPGGAALAIVTVVLLAILASALATVFLVVRHFVRKRSRGHSHPDGPTGPEKGPAEQSG
jgi:hypothetical protein